MKIKIPVGSKNRFNIDSDHITTFDFGQARPSFYRFMNPSESIKCDLSMMVRTTALTHPAYADVKFKHRGFFVPIRTISPMFDKFYSRSRVNVNGYQSEVYIPTFSNAGILNLLLSCAYKRDDDLGALMSDFKRYRRYRPSSILGMHGDIHTTLGCVDYQAHDQLDSEDFIDVENLLFRAKVGCMNSMTAQESDIVSPNDFAFDFVYTLVDKDPNNVPHKYPVFVQFKPYGRFVQKVLDSLGYQIEFPFMDYQDVTSNQVYQAMSPINEQFDSLVYNGLSILAYCKVIFDRYIPSQFASSSVLMQLFNYLTTPEHFTEPDDMRIDEAGSGYYRDDFGPLVPLGDIIFQCLPFMYQLFAGNSYFTDSWYNMNSIIDGVTADLTYYAGNKFGSDPITFDNHRGISPTVVASGNFVGFSEDNRQLQSQSDLTQTVGNASAVGHKWLQGIYNLFKRTNLAGNRVVQTLLSNFGVAPSSEKVNECVYLGCKSHNLQIVDVTQSASTEVAELGSYAGKGYSVVGEGKEFSYTADSWGIFLVISSVSATGGYCQGVDRANLIYNPLEFWNGNLEKTGTEPVHVEEFLAPPTKYGFDAFYTRPNDIAPNYYVNGVFGFRDRYSWAKYGRSMLTGDFRIKHLGGSPVGNMQGWHTFRMFQNPLFEPYNRVTHQIDVEKLHEQEGFAQLGCNPVAQGDILYNNGKQFNRIFNLVDDAADHFVCAMHFNASLFSPMLQLENSVDIDGFREVNIDGSNEAFN